MFAPTPPDPVQSAATLINDSIRWASHELDRLRVPELMSGYLHPLLTSMPEPKLAVRDLPVHQATGTRFIRIAGISGALAIYLGAYGAHVLQRKKAEQRLRDTFEIASYYHYIHSVALLTCPMTRWPILTGSLMTSGMLVFSGSCYAHALTGDEWMRPFTPYGAFLLILGWLSIAV